MRFTFGHSNRFIYILYAAGLPIVLITFFNRILGWGLINEQLNLQLFLLGAINVTLAAVVNLILTIMHNHKRSEKDNL